MNPGIAATWTTFAVAIASGFLYLLAGGGKERLRPWADRAFRLQAVLLVGLVVWLWHLLTTHQFQYPYVASYTSRALDTRFLFAALWGGQQGTFLLWATLGGFLGSALLRSKNRLVPTAMFFLNWAQIFLLLILVIEGPFKTMLPAPLDGQGLNPLLQDYWMTIHPPVLFLGYSSLIVPFALALSALVHRDSTSWLRIAPPWSMFSTVVLATGFTMGGIWAYKVLGWGGFWGWDPVENASFVPWLMNAALFHGMLVQRATGALKRTNLLLGTLPFLFVLYGSFLTRSGVLADFSVHSFVDLGLNGYLLFFLGSFAAAAFGIWGVRQRHFADPTATIGAFSREFGLWLGMLTFLLMGVLTMLGTSAPLLTRLYGAPGAVQTSYYGIVNGILGIVLALLAGLSPLVRWRHDEPERVLRTLAAPAIVCMAGATAAVLIGVHGWLALTLFAAAVFALAANASLAVRALRRGLAFASPYVSHLGFAVFLVGVLTLGQFGRHEPIELPLGQPRQALGYELEYRGLRPDPGGRAHAEITVRGGGRSFEARTPIWYSEYNRGVMREPHVERFWTGDLYISPVELRESQAGATSAPLARGESGTVGGARLTFEGFAMQRTADEVRVTADVLVERGEQSERVRPVVVVNAAGRSAMPVTLADGGQLSLGEIDAGAGRAVLALSGPGTPATPEALAVEVSTKPMILLVWGGMAITLLGALLAMLRRARGPARLPDTPV